MSKAVSSNLRIAKEFAALKLRDLQIVKTLGVGGFGRVELVTVVGDESRSYALKVMKKNHVVETKQQDHIMNEARIMKDAHSDFIVKSAFSSLLQLLR